VAGVDWNRQLTILLGVVVGICLVVLPFVVGIVLTS
jgi:tetrahydromethanopterin S-methyltransferase subunit G